MTIPNEARDRAFDVLKSINYLAWRTEETQNAIARAIIEAEQRGEQRERAKWLKKMGELIGQ